MLAISLYTSRVVLATLGINDFGLYNVVGGIVSILAFLNISMSGATQRFLNIELGKKDNIQLELVFSTARFIHLCIAFIIFLIAETLGVWFLNEKMNIADDRIIAANWVYQFSIISFMQSIISVPYNASIIAHEKMSAFAYITIIEAVLKLSIVLLLSIVSLDKLIVYAGLIALVSIIIQFIYRTYCRTHFEETKSLCLKYNKQIIHEMLGFSGWTAVGSLASISHTQGIAIVINLFFSVSVNAALGITNQVINVVNQFVSNFMTALNPQIVKTYAAHEFKEMHNLIIRGSKLGICLVSFFAIPILIETPMILNLWLKDVPDYTVTFIRIVLITSICNSYASPLAAAKGATGDIKNYQIVLTSIGLMHIPIAWICFECGGSPYWAMLVYLVLVNIMQIVRIYMVGKSINMSIKEFYVKVLMKCALMILLASIISITAHSLLPKTLVCIFITITLTFISVAITSFYIVLSITERKMIKDYILSKIKN